jgi:hypothetical protein
MSDINMPAGGIQQIDGDELFWFRKAFDSEWKGAVMLRLSDDRIYSTESVEDLGRKFSEAGVPVAGMTPPDARMKIYVNADNVKNVDQSDAILYHEKAQSVLVFSRKISLAVREDKKGFGGGRCDPGHVIGKSLSVGRIERNARTAGP